MNLKEWSDQIANWKQKYGVPDHGGPRRFRPEEVKLACAKCHRLRHRMSRHHKANDYLFANLLPDVYARRYIEFRKEDVDKLCERCHKRWHIIVKPIVRRILTSAKIGIVNEERCEAWRKIILDKYTIWINIPIPKRKHHGKRKRRKRRRKSNPA
jgi:hypothetical protein